MSLLSIFLTFVAIIVVFGVLAWLINMWVTNDTAKKLAWSALVVFGVVIFLVYVVGGAGHVPVLR